MATIFIFHGVYGSPDENWFPWLKEKLKAQGHRVVVPAFPHPEKPTLEEWMEAFQNSVAEGTPVVREAEPYLPPRDSIFIGHSLGAAFALRFLERTNTTIQHCHLVAPVWCTMGNEFDALMMTFTEAPYDWKKVKAHAGKFTVLYSDNDPYIKPSLAEALAENLDVKSTLVKGAGHFNAKAGYTRFDLLLSQVCA